MVSSSSKIERRMGRGEWAKVRKVLWYSGSCVRVSGAEACPAKASRACAVSHSIDKRQAFSSEVASVRMASSVTSGSSDQVT